MTQTQKTIIFSIFYILGLVAYFSNQIISFTIVIFLLLVFLLFKNITSKKFTIILCCIFVFGIINSTIRTQNEDYISYLAPSTATIEGTIISIPNKSKENTLRFDCEVNNIKNSKESISNIKNKTRILLEYKSDKVPNIQIGDYIKIEGKLRSPIQAGNPSQFSYKNFLKNYGIFTTFYANENHCKVLKKPDKLKWKILQKLNITRNIIIKKHSQRVHSPNIEVLGGMVFGDDAINPPDYIKTSFINSGLFHILAASGMNVAIIFGICFFITRRLRINYRLSILAGMITIAIYSLMTGLGAPIVRATLMIEAVLFGKLIDRQADSIALLAFVGFIMLLFSPQSINEIGFQLSFVVTLGILLIAPKLNNLSNNNFINKAGEIILIPIIAQLWVFPIQMNYFNTFSLYSIFANIIILPFVSIISFVGFISSILCLIPPISNLVCLMSDFILNPVISGLIYIANIFSHAPHCLLSTPKPSLAQFILYYSFLLLINFALVHGFKNKKQLITISILLILLLASLIKIPQNNLEIIFFDVGNADSFLIKTPQDEYILIDTGKQAYNKGFIQAETIIGKYLKDHNIRKINTLILTHFDSDHAGGAEYLMNNFKTENILLLPTDNTTIANNIYRTIKQKNIKYQNPKNNAIIKNQNDLKIKLLIPNDKSENESSIITLLSYKDFDTLFMGDAGVKGYENIKAYLPKNIEILKIGHHGAKSTLNQEMLKKLNIKTAIISTGYNTYGHPAIKTTKILQDNNVPFYRTDYNGAVTIKSDGQNYKIKTFIK